MASPLAERSAYGPCGSDRTVVPQGHIAGAEVEPAECRGVINVQGPNRREIGAGWVAKDREGDRMVLIEEVVELERVVKCTVATCGITQELEEAGIDPSAVGDVVAVTLCSANNFTPDSGVE